MCLVFPPLVSLYGLFPVLDSCHYELILFQVCVCDCVNYPVYLSPVCWVPCRLVYLLLPVFLCVYLALSYLDVVIKDYYFEVYPRLRVPRFSLLCVLWQKTRPNSKRRPFTSFCFVRFFKWLFCFSVLSLAASESARREPSCPPFAGVYAAVRGSPIPPFAAHRARRSQEMTPPSTANPSPPARRWINARRPPSDSMPAGLPLTQCPPDGRWLKPAGSPLSQARRIAADSCPLAAVRGES